MAVHQNITHMRKINYIQGNKTCRNGNITMGTWHHFVNMTVDIIQPWASNFFQNLTRVWYWQRIGLSFEALLNYLDRKVT